MNGLDDPRYRIATTRSIQMVHEIGRRVLVEGVETDEQARTLADMGADYLQGYLYSRPLPEADYTAFLEEHATS